jgi:putative PIN family toxin of toxin-antitoxin system
MIRVVLDTNVLVSGILSEKGPPAKILDLMLDGALVPIVEPRIIAEYRDVLARPKLSLDQAHVKQLLDVIETVGSLVAAPPWPRPMPDADDEVFIAAAHCGAATLITGNLVHYPVESREGVEVMSPRDFWEYLRQQLQKRG